MFKRGCHGLQNVGRMVQNVVGFAATCAISTYHHLSCEFEPCSGDITEILLKVALNNINQTIQLKQLHLYHAVLGLTLYFRCILLYPCSTEGVVYCFTTVRPSVYLSFHPSQDIFRRISLSNY